MPTVAKPQARIKFYQEDIVHRIDDPSRHGVVMRCWHDSDDLRVPEEELLRVDPLLRPLQRGEVGVSFFPGNTREICPEENYKLVDRPFQAGDACKRNIEDVQSAVVKSVDVRFKVAHVISNAKMDGWLSERDIEDFDDIVVGEIVAYGDWIGQVQEMFDETVIQVSDGSLVRLPEITSRLCVGDRGSDILPPLSEDGKQTPGDVQPSEKDVVIAVKHSVLVISWMAINQALTPEETASRQRPQRMWFGDDLKNLTLLRGPDNHVVRVGDKVTLRNPPAQLLTRHGNSNGRSGQIVVDKFYVCETETVVTALWQDGTTEKINAAELVPYLNPDEYDCWPGDHILWKTEDAKQHAVVQSVNAAQRLAEILLSDGRRELVPVLELDPRGSDGSLESPHEAFGVGRTDLVFIHAEGSAMSHEKPMVPLIGELEPWVYDPPTIEDGGEFTGWRKELDDIGQRLAHSCEPSASSFVRISSQGGSSIDWFGEVSDLRLDGLVDVALPDHRIIAVPIERLSRLNDGFEQLEDAWGDHLFHHAHGMDEGVDDILEYQCEDGHWHTYDDAEDKSDWVDEEEWVDNAENSGEDGEDVVMLGMDEDGIMADGNTISAPVQAIPGAWTTERPSGASNATVTLEAPSGAENTGNSSNSQNGATNELQEGMEVSWKRFDIMPSAPPDHAFYSTSPTPPSKQYMSRMSREYKALMTSLPDSIIVRTYEDRTDLLRSLIIGPENTPYEDAPFVIDWMLDSNFPQTPPIAHFLSWTNGNGRVNPNLYEEGKVCLSILGTWAGDRSESWSAARSSLLQAFVSIQGLVLVKEPWFCEPTYEKWRDTDEGKVNSRLYNEKAYVLSRGFVRRALEIPLGGLEDVINDIYYRRGRLERVIAHANDLVAKSKDLLREEIERVGDDGLAVPRLTAGGVIALSRTMVKLENIYSTRKGAPT